MCLFICLSAYLFVCFCVSIMKHLYRVTYVHPHMLFHTFFIPYTISHLNLTPVGPFHTSGYICQFTCLHLFTPAHSPTHPCLLTINTFLFIYFFTFCSFNFPHLFTPAHSSTHTCPLTSHTFLFTPSYTCPYLLIHLPPPLHTCDSP